MNTNTMKSAIGKWCRINSPSLSYMMDQWNLIDEIEYKFSRVFVSERINILYRKPGIDSEIYPILYTTDYDVIIKDVQSWE
jgi:hypothetical protein